MDDDPLSTSNKNIFTIVSWNINSVRARLPLLKGYLSEHAPDIVCLQEIKTENAFFPIDDLRQTGYFSYVNGQKSYNGVALLSKKELTVLKTTLPGLDDTQNQARFIEAVDMNDIHYISVYVPNGEASSKEPDNQERLLFKLHFLDKLADYAEILVKSGTRFVLSGDFNVISCDKDVYDPALFKTSALMHPDVVALFRRLIFAGLTDSYQMTGKKKPFYSFWDYQKSAWSRNHGILLDYVFLSPFLADACLFSCIDSSWRGKETPSDHAPVRCIISRKV